MPQIFSFYHPQQETILYYGKAYNAIVDAKVASKNSDRKIDIFKHQTPEATNDFIASILNGNGWSKHKELYATTTPVEAFIIARQTKKVRKALQEKLNLHAAWSQ